MDLERDDERVGSLLDQRYRIERRLGRGGSGVVYSARHEEMGRLVAIKVLRSDLFHAPDAFERFRREARAAGRLRHPNTVTVHDFGRTTDGDPFMVMELCEEGSLADRVRRTGPLPLREVAAIFRGVAAAVGAAHRAGIVHRDLKPANILFAGGAPKVADFGLARLLEEGDQGLTGAHAIGSPAYMSPEQCEGMTADARSDVYSLGVMLYEATTGRLPFAGATIQATLLAHLAGTPADPRTLRADLPSTVGAVLLRGIARQPEDRYPTPEELAEALSTAVEPRPVGRSTTARVRRSSDVALPRTPVGRQPEIARLFTLFEAARQGKGGFVSIAGEPGLGKTTLLNAFLEQVNVGYPEALTVVGRCSEHFGSSEAYLPFLDALGALLASSTRGRVEKVLRSFAPTWALQLPVLAPSGPGEPDGSARLRDRMPRELADALLALSAETPLVLALEDLHWADASSVDLLSYLAARLGRWRLLLVGTYRPEEVARTSHPLRHVLRQAAAREGTDHNAVEIVPSAFGPAEIGAYVERELGAGSPPELVEFVANATEGNPLFVVNTLNHLFQTGALVRVQDQLVLLSPLTELAETVPKGLMGVIEEKIERLDEEDRRLLQAAAVQGDAFEAAVVARLLEADELVVEERLATLARGHRLVEVVGEIDYPTGSASTRFRFVHALYQNALYASILARRRGAWHAAVAAALAALYGAFREPILVPLAVHYERARDLERAIDTNIQAAEVVGRGNPRDARPLLERARDLAVRLATAPGQEARGRQRRAEVLVRLGRHDVETAELIGDVALYDRALEAVTEALELDPDAAEARTIMGLIHLERGRNDDAFADFEQVLAAHPDHGAAWDGLSYLFKNTGLWDEALAACDLAAACDSRFAHSIRRLSVLLFRGEIAAARAEADALVAGRPRFSHYNYWKGIAEFYAGDVASCRAWVERGYAFDTEDQIGQGVFAFVLAYQGESERARQLLASAEPGAVADGTFTYWIANVYAILGDTEHAVEWIERAGDLGYWNAPWIAIDSAIDGLRGDPRFARCLSRITQRQQRFAAAVGPRWAALVKNQSGLALLQRRRGLEVP